MTPLVNVLVSKIIGTEILGLPYVATSCGWVVTMIVVLLFVIFAVHTEFQFKVAKLACSNLMVFVNSMRELMSSAFDTFIKACMLVNWCI